MCYDRTLQFIEDVGAGVHQLVTEVINTQNGSDKNVVDLHGHNVLSYCIHTMQQKRTSLLTTTLHSKEHAYNLLLCSSIHVDGTELFIYVCRRVK